MCVSTQREGGGRATSAYIQHTNTKRPGTNVLFAAVKSHLSLSLSRSLSLARSLARSLSLSLSLSLARARALSLSLSRSLALSPG